MRFKGVVGVAGAVLAGLLVSSVILAYFPEQGLGQGNSDIWVMNLHGTLDATVVTRYFDQGGNPTDGPGASISPLGNASFPASSSGLADNWLGSMVLYSNRELASVAELHWRSLPVGDGWSGAAYAGYSEGGNELFFPGIAKTLFHRTIVTIQCVDTTDCDVSMTYRNLNGTTVAGSPFADTIYADAQESYDLHDPTLNPNIPTGLPTPWYGSLQVTSANKMAGVMVVHWARGYAAAYNPIVPGTDTVIYFPAVNRRNFTGDWTGPSDWQGLTVQNLNNSEITVHVEIYAWGGGAPVLDFYDDIPAYSVGLYNTRYGGSVDRSVFDALGDIFVGSAVVTCNMPIGGLSGGVRFPSWGMAAGYQAASSGSNRLVNPLVYRVKSGAKWLNYSTIAVQNLDPNNDVDVQVQFLNSNGTVGVGFPDTIPANSIAAYSTRYGGATYEPLGTSWAGSVVVTTDDPAGTITGVIASYTQGSGGYVYMTSNNLIQP